MATSGIMIDYEWCSGCQSCEIACKNELGLTADDNLWGIKVLQIGPYQLGERKFSWDYIPVTTDLCDLCAARIEAGKDPACVHHCLANCMYYGSLEELSKKMAEKGHKAYIIMP